MSQSENKASRGSVSQIILMALSTGNKYGYEICKDIENLTNGKLVLKQPSLYSSLRRMEEQGLILSYWEDSNLGGKRHYYSITDKGKDFFEKNQTNWQSKDDLINSLPSKDFNDEEKDLQNQTYSPTSYSSTVVLNQENLFNINRKNEDIKKINEKVEDINKSFFQFDLFDQSVKFVRETKKTEQILSFENKYSNLDEHKTNIEPKISETLENFNVNEVKRDSETLMDNFENKLENLENQEEKIEKDDNKQEEINVNLQELKEIKREEVFSDVNFDENNSTISSNLSSSIDLIESLNKEENLDIKADPLTSFEKVSQEINLDLNKDNEKEKEFLSNQVEPVFESNDYRSLIGKLYDNSKLTDPYEANKFQTFKEIFPSSQYKQPKKEVLSNVIENIKQTNASNNINCDDIKMLNNLFNLQGINIKCQNGLENKKQNRIYTDKNKLNMITSWFISLVMILEIFLCYIILNENALLFKNQYLVYFLGLAVTISYCIVASLENVFERFKLIIIKKNFNKMFVRQLFFFIISVILIFITNLCFGMTSLAQIEYLSFWLVPVVLSTNFVLFCLIYNLLLKSKYFNK